MAASPEGLQVLSTQHFEVESPNNQLVGDMANSKDEEQEWVTRKKVEVVTKRQIATRVQREVLLEDGKVVQDSGPKVTTTTTEDTRKNESENTEHHDLGDGTTEGWMVSGDPNVVTEIREKKVTTREQTNETLETEDIKHLGDISDEAYKKAVENGGNVENWLVRSSGTEVARTGPRVVGHTSIKRRVTDTEDTLKKKAVDQNGKVVFNTSTIKEHEEVIDDPELNNDKGSSSSKELKFKKTKDQQFVDYVVDGQPAGREMRYDAETTEVMRHGDADWDSLSARLRRNRNKFLKEIEDDRKDALTKRPLDFNQEERTRKVETSKWLDHHFGSESASRSSRESEDDGPHTSFINVTMKSSNESKPSRVFLPTPEPEKSYFKGISEWKSEDRRFSKSPKIEGGVQVLPTGPNHSFDSSPSPPHTSSPLHNGHKSPSPLQNGHKSPSPTHNRSKSPSPPLNGISRKYPSAQNLERSSPHGREERFIKTTNYYKHERTTSPFGRHSPAYNGHSNGHSISHSNSHSRSGSTPTNGLSNGKATPTRDYTPPSISPPPRRKHYRHQEKEEEVLEEPAPDYSPTPEPKSRHNTPPPDGKKKVYQRTRFAADIPPPRAGPPTKADKRGGLGESFRKLVGKLVGKPKGAGQVDSGTQTRAEMNGLGRYYLGEDPFNSSLYGRESEYQPQYNRRAKHKHEDSRHGSSNSSSTLGRLSKSTSKLSGSDRQAQHNGTTLYYNDRGGVQTLPRKLQEHKAKKQVYVTRSNGDSSYGDRSNRLGNNSSSMFNVSIVSNTGPAKPARTYRSNLARSKSFNVHAGDSYRDSSRYTSNPHLSRLDESTELKSPGLITSISRSTRDLTSEDSFRRPLGTYDTNRYTKLNGLSSSRTSNIDSHKKLFMKGLMERAPELYKTLHGNDLDENRTVEPVRTSTPLKNGKLEYSTSFRSSNTSSPLDRVTSPYYQYRTDSPDGINRSVVRRGSNGDYTETVRYTSTSKDPTRPSVTNTVQSVTKKTVPMPGGGEHRIRSSETKTVTKSKFRSGTPELHFDGKYPTSNGGVIIEVRNTRK